MCVIYPGPRAAYKSPSGVKPGAGSCSAGPKFFQVSALVYVPYKISINETFQS